MGATRARWPVPALFFLASLCSVTTHALTIDTFDTDVLVAVTAVAPDSDSASSPDDANMIGDREITVEKTTGDAGLVNAATAEAVNGLLGMANGPVTNSVITAEWTFGSTDLTEGGTQTGIFVSLPDPIDNDLTIAFSINGGTPFAIVFPDGSSGDDFFFPFSGFANSAEAIAATSLSVSFSDGVAWDAEVDFIATRGPPPPPPPEAPPGNPPPKIPAMSAPALWLTALGLVLVAAGRLARRKVERSLKRR